jgi:hypothetical protein
VVIGDAGRGRVRIRRHSAHHGTRVIAPLTGTRDLDSVGLLDNVTTLNYHPHLPNTS